MKLVGKHRSNNKERKGIRKTDNNPRFVVSNVAELKIANTRKALLLCLSVHVISVSSVVVQKKNNANHHKQIGNHHGRRHRDEFRQSQSGGSGGSLIAGIHKNEVEECESKGNRRRLQ
jgi:hypothetical protein